MYVDPTHRGQAVNGKIVDALKTWCRARQITELRLEVYSGNRAAIRAYQKQGFAEHMLEMRLGLNDASPMTDIRAKADAKGKR
jgi:GNAT superfamily N-acetyltransferase